MIDRILKIIYKNWKGETSTRFIIPKGNLYWGSTEYHKEEQWLLDVYDVDKEADRTYAFKDIEYIFKDTEPTPEAITKVKRLDGCNKVVFNSPLYSDKTYTYLMSDKHFEYYNQLTNNGTLPMTPTIFGELNMVGALNRRYIQNVDKIKLD